MLNVLFCLSDFCLAAWVSITLQAVFSLSNAIFKELDLKTKNAATAFFFSFPPFFLLQFPSFTFPFLV